MKPFRLPLTYDPGKEKSMIRLKKEKVRKYLTPYKYNEPVLAGSGRPGAFDEKSVDVPFVFRHNDRFYMVYTGFDGKVGPGYQR